MCNKGDKCPFIYLCEIIDLAHYCCLCLVAVYYAHGLINCLIRIRDLFFHVRCFRIIHVSFSLIHNHRQSEYFSDFYILEKKDAIRKATFLYHNECLRMSNHNARRISFVLFDEGNLHLKAEVPSRLHELKRRLLI